MDNFRRYNGEVIGDVKLAPQAKVLIEGRAIRRSRDDARLYFRMRIEHTGMKDLVIGADGQHPNTLDAGYFGIIVSAGNKLYECEIGHFLKEEEINGLVQSVQLTFQDSPDKIGSHELLSQVTLQRNLPGFTAYLWADVHPLAAKWAAQFPNVFIVHGEAQSPYEAVMAKVLVPA